MKDWKHIDRACSDCCGNNVEVLTDCKHKGHVYDGDVARCVECGANGSAVVDGEVGGWIDWDVLDKG